MKAFITNFDENCKWVKCDKHRYYNIQTGAIYVPIMRAGAKPNDV